MDINGFPNWCICLWNWLAGNDITGCQVMRALFRKRLGGCKDRKLFGEKKEKAAERKRQLKEENAAELWKPSALCKK